MILQKIEKEFARFKKKWFFSGRVHKQLEKSQYWLENMPYELYDKISSGSFAPVLPVMKTLDETIDKLVQDRCSVSRFGDGEFCLIRGGRIHYQASSEALARRLREIVTSDIDDLLIALPPCFGSLDHFLEPVGQFWRKNMARNRQIIYSYLDMNRIYYDAFISRIYIQCPKTDEHYTKCTGWFRKIKALWQGKDIVICEGQGTRFGVGNDFLKNARSISRVLCPARNAFSVYEQILIAFESISTDMLILVSLGPTATVLCHDLCTRGFQCIDIGALDIDYEWYLRKETALGKPVEFKYVDSGKRGRTIIPLDDPEYKRQIIKTIGIR